MSTPVRVLIVDDSPTVRKVLTRELDRDPDIEVIGTASDPYDAKDKIINLKPDVLTLDLEMPRMDGLTFLKIIMERRPMPVIIISSLSQKGSLIAMEALQAGAFDVLGKPFGSHSVGILGRQVVEKVKAASIARLRVPGVPVRPKTSGSIVPASHRFDPRQVILIGASTGGTEALKAVMTDFPDNLPGICIVQHIPAYFSRAFAERLNSICRMRVKEAEEGDRVEPGVALVAPGDYHMILRRLESGYRVSLRQGPKIWYQRPAVDILFKTAVEAAGRHAVAAILTGMGRDGAEGMHLLHNEGAHTIAQNEETCVVYGMPKAAYEMGAVDEVLPLGSIAKSIQENALKASRKERPVSAA